VLFLTKEESAGQVVTLFLTRRLIIIDIRTNDRHICFQTFLTDVP
jgi:hypothetical protein